MPTPPISSTTDPEEVIKLICPTCQGRLNLKRKHLGMKGKCVHCSAPVMAVETPEGIRLQVGDAPAASQTSAASAPASSAPLPETQSQLDQAPSEPAPAPAGPVAEATPTASSPAASAAPETVETSSSASEENGSQWGFPQRNDDVTPPANASPVASPPPLEDPESGLSSEEKEEVEVAKISSPEPSEDPIASPHSDQPSLGGSALFAQGPGAGSSALFGSPQSDEDEVEVNSGWGTKMPTQNHASISPFTTGSAADDPGFAQTLFAGGATTNGAQPAQGSDNGIGLPQNGNHEEATSSASAESGEEVVLDGDGRPMRPMTDEEKEVFANEMMSLGDYRQRSPWVKRIKRFFVTIVLLAGIGYAAYVFLPRDIVNEWKDKALTWLEPGSGMLDMNLIPVEVVEGENGEKEVKVKAVQGLNDLTDKMDSYLDVSEQNMRDAGMKVEEREEIEKMDMPQIPKIPKLPFKLPGASSEEGEAATEE